MTLPNGPLRKLERMGRFPVGAGEVGDGFDLLKYWWLSRLSFMP